MAREDIDITGGPQDDRISVSDRGIEIRRRGKPVSSEVSVTGFVYLVIDCSASMAGDKLTQAKRGALDFATEARTKGYSIGLIQFESSATHICEPQRELSVLRRYVDELKLGGTTDMAGGIRLAANKLQDESSRLRAMLVVTDGQPDSREDALSEAEQAKRHKIDIITIGTDDADRAFLKRLASRTELSVMVSSHQLAEGIASTAKMLPAATPRDRVIGG